MDSIAYLSVSKKPLAKEILTLESKFLKLDISKRGGLLDSIEAKTTFIDEIKAKKFEDESLKELKEKIVNVEAQETTLDEAGVLSVKERICVPRVEGLIGSLMVCNTLFIQV